MKTAIIAFDALNNPRSCSSKVVESGSTRKEFHRMKAAQEMLGGLPIVELWNQEGGCIERYIAKPNQQTKRSKAHEA